MTRFPSPPCAKRRAFTDSVREAGTTFALSSSKQNALGIRIQPIYFGITLTPRWCVRSPGRVAKLVFLRHGAVGSPRRGGHARSWPAISHTPESIRSFPSVGRAGAIRRPEAGSVSLTQFPLLLRSAFRPHLLGLPSARPRSSQRPRNTSAH